MSDNKVMLSGLVTSKYNCFKIRWIQKLNIYKTHNRFYVVGSNVSETKYRILKIDRTEPWDLVIIEDGIDYTKSEMADTVTRLYGGNSTTKWKKGLQEVISSQGIIGFVRFLEGYYMIMITKQRKVAEIGGHSIYKVEDTMMLYLPNHNIREPHPDEPRYLKTFQTVDLSSNFYFSYSYDLTNSLQYNLVQLHQSSVGIKKEMAKNVGYPYTNRKGKTVLPCRRFVWNNYLMEPFESHCISPLWMLPVIHGHVTQSCINIYGQLIYITLIARRSSNYAGTRFMKRGCNIKGDVANEVETEQIVHCASTSSLHHASLTSFLQHRGSVPIHWQQDMTANVMPSKPPITITNDNPYAQATSRHFKQMIERFGTPIIVLNLVRKRERRFRESILGYEYKCAVDYLNQFLQTDQQIRYFAVDMAHLARGKKSNVLNKLAHIAEQCVQATGIFQSKPDLFQNKLKQDPRWEGIGGHRLCGYRIQTGVLRTNCVDCLDRTNSAQFIAGKCALAYQLYSLGVLSEPDIHFETDVTRLYEEMFEAHGDIVALQYGGSQLVHTIQSYRRTVAPWASQGRDIVTTISRYYTNTFSDADKQSAINLFLGIFRPASVREKLWDISTDHYLHNRDVDVLASIAAHNYTRWCGRAVFVDLPLPFEMIKSITDAKKSSEDNSCHKRLDASSAHCKDCTDWYEDLHNPSQLTVFEDVFALNLTSTYSRFLSANYTDTSPFAVRSENWQQLKQERMQTSPSPSLFSLDESSNEYSESDDDEVISKHVSLDYEHQTNSDSSNLPPWLRKPTLEDFSARVAYVIDLDNYATAEDTEQYESYISCTELSDEFSLCTEYEDDSSLYEPPTVDAESLKLYKESVTHTYEVDRQFYIDYLSRYKSI